jgi:hypothetical protein
MPFLKCLSAVGLRSPFEIENAKEKKKAYAVGQNGHHVLSGKAVHDPQGDSKA